MSEVPDRETFESAYEGKPPWDLGRPQKPFIDVADQITGTVLDTGCGTGENALFFAERGQTVLGIDFITTPIETARRKAEQRGAQAEFLQLDALRLKDLGRIFDSVIDSGLFHVFSDEDRLRYVEGLAYIVKPGGKIFLMCFSDAEPGDKGPRRISQSELRQAFSEGWTVESITASQFETNSEAEEQGFSEGGPKAWFAVIRAS